MPTVYVSIGSNIERELNIRAGVAELKAHFGALTLSRVYEAAAVGFDGEPFYNLIAAFETQLSPKDVDLILDEIEKNNGRTPEQKKFNSRTLDLDLTLYGDYISKDSTLEIPRSEILCYAFVLEPLAEIAGELLHPISQISYAQLWQQFDNRKVMQKAIPFNWKNN
jgi:2-amino-4-hydroxy-6-hydroxymethyldihydropteridine diphosphokinase